MVQLCWYHQILQLAFVGRIDQLVGLPHIPPSVCTKKHDAISTTKNTEPNNVYKNLIFKKTVDEFATTDHFMDSRIFFPLAVCGAIEVTSNLSRVRGAFVIRRQFLRSTTARRRHILKGNKGNIIQTSPTLLLFQEQSDMGIQFIPVYRQTCVKVGQSSTLYHCQSQILPRYLGLPGGELTRGTKRRFCCPGLLVCRGLEKQSVLKQFQLMAESITPQQILVYPH